MPFADNNPPGPGEILAGAIGLLREDRLTEAEAAFEAVLRTWPQQPDALHYLGVLRHAQGRHDDAIVLVRESLALQPRNAGAWNNLGNILLLSGAPDAAADAWQRSIDAGGAASAQALSNLAVLYRKQGRPADAEQAARRAIAVNAEDGDAWYRLSQALLDQGQVREGLLANSRAVSLWPRHQQARGDVLRALVMLGEKQRAQALYREWLDEEPDNPIARHLLAATESGDKGQDDTPPSRASDAYVEEVFDHFAESFDSKLESLHYQAPVLVAERLHQLLPAPDGTLDVADLGCGTGLCGPHLKPYAKRLAGCDLSVGMLRRAKARGVYDVLHKAELGYYLETQPARFDLLVSADTLIYFGDLRPVLGHAHAALRPGGWLVFSVEALPEHDSADWRLQPTGRYAHGRGPLTAHLAEAGFTDVDVQPAVLRTEGGRPVAGWLASGRHAADGDSAARAG
jgi:predicted TPR repeat methyltransferase